MAAPTAKDMMIAAGGGVASAALFLATVFNAAGALLAYLALLPLFAIGLGWGLKAVVVSATVATVMVTALTTVAVGLLFAIVYAVPALLTVRLGLWHRQAGDGATDWYPIGRSIAWLAVYGCGCFTILALIGGDSGVRETLAQIEAVMTSVLPVDQNPQVATLVRTIAGIFPAIVVFSWTVMTAVNAVLAQGALERFRRNLRPKPRYAEIELPEWYAAVAAGAAALALIAPALDLAALGFAARNSALALLGPYLFVGLAVVHVWARRWPARLAFLAGFYLLLLVFGWVGMLLVAGLGFMEQWLFLRRRFAAGHGQEDEQ